MAIVSVGVLCLECVMWFGPVAKQSGVHVNVGSDAAHVLPIAAWLIAVVRPIDPSTQGIENAPPAPLLDKSAELSFRPTIEGDGGVGTLMLDPYVAPVGEFMRRPALPK